MGEMTQEEIARVAKTLRPAMVNAMVTGNAYGTRVIGKVVTRNALRSRGLIDDASRWTALGWAVVLHVVSTEPGWSMAHFKSPEILHAEALQEDADRFPAPIHNGWQQIPGHPAGNIRCIETGIEIRAIGHGFRWEVLYPMWQRPTRKVLRTDRIFTTKIEALGHATRYTRPAAREQIAAAYVEARGAAAHVEALGEDARRRTLARLDGLPEPLVSGDTVPGFRGGKVPPLRDRIHAGAYGPDVAAFDINIGDGSLTAAAGLVTRAVKRAQYDALRAVLASLDAWIEGQKANHEALDHRGERAPCWESFDVASIRNLVNDAARDLRVREPWRSESGHVCAHPDGGCTDCPDLQ